MAKNKALAKSNTDLVTQSNALIESSYRMSIPAKKVMLMLLSEIHPCQKNVTTKLRIQAADYAARTGTDIKRSYSDIKNGCRELMRTIITMRNQSAKTTEEYAKLHPRKTQGKTTKEVVDMMQRDNRNV